MAQSVIGYSSLLNRLNSFCMGEKLICQSLYEPAHMKRAQLQKLINTEIFADLCSTSSPKAKAKDRFKKCSSKVELWSKMYTLVKIVFHSLRARVITEFDFAFTPKSVHILSWNFNTQNFLCKRRNWLSYQEHIHTHFMAFTNYKLTQLWAHGRMHRKPRKTKDQSEINCHSILGF